MTEDRYHGKETELCTASALSGSTAQLQQWLRDRHSGGKQRNCRWAALVAVLTAVVLLFTALFVGKHMRSGGVIRSLLGGRQRDCSQHRSQMEVSRLPETIPADEDEMLRTLFKHITEPNPNTCRRVLRFGGDAVHSSRVTVTVWGGKAVCLDPKFGFLDAGCLTYTFVGAEPADGSFGRAVERFGCEVHTQPSSQLETASLPEGHGDRPVSVLALTDGQAALQLLETPPPLLDSHVQQLSLRLDLTPFLQLLDPEATAEPQTVPLTRARLQPAFGRRLYSALLRLQRLGFHLFSYQSEEPPDLYSIVTPGVDELPSNLIELSWLRSHCLDSS